MPTTTSSPWHRGVVGSEAERSCYFNRRLNLKSNIVVAPHANENGTNRTRSLRSSTCPVINEANIIAPKKLIDETENITQSLRPIMAYTYSS
jgi:hypothetical protein